MPISIKSKKKKKNILKKWIMQMMKKNLDTDHKIRI